MFIRVLSVLFLFSNIFSQEDFSEGPYGINYFDTAGPFSVQDLNSPVMGDVNSDDVLNIQDIILVIGNILGTIDLDNEQFKLLILACSGHTFSKPETKTDVDKSIAACWDADRLDLRRVGITPDPNRLFTKFGKFISS